MGTHYIFVIWNLIRNKGEISRETNYIKAPSRFLLIVQRRFLCYSSSLCVDGFICLFFFVLFFIVFFSIICPLFLCSPFCVSAPRKHAYMYII